MRAHARGAIVFRACGERRGIKIIGRFACLGRERNIESALALRCRSKNKA